MEDYKDFLRNSLNEQSGRRERRSGLSKKRMAIAMMPDAKKPADPSMLSHKPYGKSSSEPNLPEITPDDYISAFDNYRGPGRGATATHKAMDDTSYGAMDAEGGVEGIIERY